MVKVKFLLGEVNSVINGTCLIIPVLGLSGSSLMLSLNSAWCVLCNCYWL